MTQPDTITTKPAVFKSPAERAEFILDIYAATIQEADNFKAVGVLLSDLEDYFSKRNIVFI